MKPLEGLRIVVTRAAHQAEELAQPLRESGAEVILAPVIGIAPPNNPGPLREAAKSDSYQWVIFTSANSVLAFADELKRLKRKCNARVATVGSATREAAEANGLQVRMMPESYVAESLVDAFSTEDLSQARVLIPSAAATRDVVAPALRQRGARVDVVEAYRNILPPEAPTQARALFSRRYPDWVTFASSSAVTNLVNIIGTDVLLQSKLASIGPLTSDTVRSFGLDVTAEANPHTVQGLVQAIVSSAS